MPVDYVREQDGVLRKVYVEKLAADPRGCPATRSFAPIFKARPPGRYVFYLPPQVRAAGERIAREHGITFATMASRSRYPNIVHARHRWWISTKWSLGLSYPETGALFGVDHTTVMAAADNVEKWLEQEYAPGAASSKHERRDAEAEEAKRSGQEPSGAEDARGGVREGGESGEP